ncbi:MAG: EamA/RhaT family transporter, partial [Cutibacterium granulosum]|nr:EamA/RhaT family transporter [Cutibacterium granulosum]
MAMLWGSTLIVMKNAYAHMDPASLLSNRFIMA